MALKHHSCASGGTRFDAASVWQRGSSYVTVRSGGGGGCRQARVSDAAECFIGGRGARQDT